MHEARRDNLRLSPQKKKKKKKKKEVKWGEKCTF